MLPLSVIALVESFHVIQGLLLGVGLHGYFMDGGKGDGSAAILLSVWGAFIKAILSFCLVGALLILVWCSKRIEGGINNSRE